MLLTKKVKINVSEKGQASLEFMQAKCRGLYNWWIGKLRNGEKWKLFAAKKSLQACKEYDPKLNQVYGKLLAEVYFRLDKAMKAFFARCKKGKAGFPRFKPRHEFFTLLYPAMYLKVTGNKIVLPTGGKGGKKAFPNVVAELTESPPEKFQEVSISRDKRGNYYCSFVHEIANATCQKTGILAIDLGIKTLA